MHIDAARNYASGYSAVKDVTCRPQTTRDSLPGSEIVKIDDFEPVVSISVFKYLHSTNTGVTDPDAVPIAATVKGECTPTVSKGNTFRADRPRGSDCLVLHVYGQQRRKVPLRMAQLHG